MIALSRELDSGSSSKSKTRKKKSPPKETSNNGKPLPDMWRRKSAQFSMSEKELGETHKSQRAEGFFNPISTSLSPKISFFSIEKPAPLNQLEFGDSILTPRPVRATSKVQIPNITLRSHEDLAKIPGGKVTNPRLSPSRSAQSFSA
jgi:hypothetical protein